MRVLFLTLYPDSAASPRYRVTRFLPYLREAGIDCTVAAPMTEAAWRRHTGPDRRGRAMWYHLHETPRRLMQILSARRYDVVFLQKAVMSAYIRGLPELLNLCGRRLVYDIDDAVHLAPPHPLRAPWSLLEDRRQIYRIFEMAGLVLAGNRWLAETAEAAGAKAECFPTVVDTGRFHPAGKAPEVFRAGWMGSPATTYTLRNISNVLDSLENTEILLAGADPGKVDLQKACVLPWSLQSEAEVIQSFSIGLMPQEKDEWTRGKCALKALLYMACGVPCVATPWGAVMDIIRHGENGLFAETETEWRDAIEALRDPELRSRLGQAARDTVLEKYSLAKAGPRMAALLKETAA